MKFNPKVSIVIPVYNGANYLGQAIESALNQTYKNIEIIVVNDGSKDDGATEKVALSYGNKIRYILKENGGVASALNGGIREMSGEYFTWLSHDDLLYPDKTAKQVQILSVLQDKDIIIYSDYDVIDENSKIIHNYKWKNPPVSKNPRPSFRHALLPNNPMFFCTMLVPKKCFMEIGLFDETSRTCQDYEMCFRLAGKYKFIYQIDKTAKNRVHKFQVSKNKIIIFKKEYDVSIYNMIQENDDNYSSLTAPEDISFYYYKLSFLLKKKGARKSAELALSRGDQYHGKYGLYQTMIELFTKYIYLLYTPYIDPLYWLRYLKRLIIK